MRCVATTAVLALLILDHACAFLSTPGLSVCRRGGVMRDGAIMMRATDRDLLVVGTVLRFCDTTLCFHCTS
jgi:hypothetical protein